MEYLTHAFHIDNLHCGGCERAIHELLSPLVHEVHVSLHEDSVSVATDSSVEVQEISKILYNGGFDVISVDSEAFSAQRAWWFGRWLRSKRRSKAHKRKCDKCRHKGLDDDLSTSLSGETAIAIDGSVETAKYRAIYSIGGMSCAACSTSITGLVKDQIPEVEEIGVDLLNKSGVVIVPNKRLASRIRDIIEDAGYSCELTEILPVSTSKSWRVTASIGGMTCSSCVYAIKENVKLLSFVREAEVSLVTNSAVFVVDDLARVSELKGSVESSGYDFEQVEVTEVSYSPKNLSRTVHLAVEGMFCE
jgi:Cu+-exporting ATPase